MAEFSIKYLSKSETTPTRHPKINKYYLSSCQTKITNRTPTTQAWLKIMNILKMDNDHDKSRVLLGELATHGEVVVKIGESDDIRREYEWNEMLQSIKGFVKYICFFQCNDDFRSITPSSRSSICKGPGSGMNVILMPWFPLGSISDFKWQEHDPVLLQSCLKHAMLSMLHAFYKLHMIHGDFHTGNVLLKKTKQKIITYNIPQLGEFTIEIHGIRPWIIDFENSKLANFTSPYHSMMSLNDFFFDFEKFFMLLMGKNKWIDPTTVVPIRRYINSLLMSGNLPSRENIVDICQLIDQVAMIPVDIGQ